MKLVIGCLLIFLVLRSFNTEAVSIPLTYDVVQSTQDTGFRKTAFARPYVDVAKGEPLIKGLKYRILQRHWKALANKPDEGGKRRSSLLSVVSLVLGLLAVIGLLAGLGIGAALLLALGAIVTGIIALGKRKGSRRGARGLAIVGLILGGGLIILFIAFIAAFSSI